jgi:sulfhydrogenase subunit delta
MPKARVGWFSFTCCEDSTMIFLEVLNDKYWRFGELMEFKYFKALKESHEIPEMDLAFVEGAVSTQKEEDKVKKIREKSKKVIAIGACACTGMPSAQRNSFDQKTKEEVQFIVSRFNLKDKVLSLKEVIPIDYEVPGCPMDEGKFLQVTEAALRDLGFLKEGEKI